MTDDGHLRTDRIRTMGHSDNTMGHSDGTVGHSDGTRGNSGEERSAIETLSQAILTGLNSTGNKINMKHLHWPQLTAKSTKLGVLGTDVHRFEKLFLECKNNNHISEAQCVNYLKF